MSDVSIGAIISQRSPVDNKLYPRAFLSKKLSLAERNYDVGNRELLAVKEALEEWRHWLERVEHPVSGPDRSQEHGVHPDRQATQRQTGQTGTFLSARV